jgi:hypothetical protein
MLTNLGARVCEDGCACPAAIYIIRYVRLSWTKVCVPDQDDLNIMFDSPCPAGPCAVTAQRPAVGAAPCPTHYLEEQVAGSLSWRGANDRRKLQQISAQRLLCLASVKPSIKLEHVSQPQ